KILEAAGYNATAVNNGAEAIKAVEEKEYDLILMDIQMPEVDGFTATQRIRNFESEKKNIPIIALTAHALMGDRDKCIKTGMNDYLPKPIIAKDLIGLIDRILDIKNSPKEPKNGINPVEEDSSLFDFERLKKVSAGDFDFEKDLLSSYLDDISEKLEQMSKSVKEKDTENIINIAHTLKGASYSVGAQRVGDEAFGIEISGKSNDLPSIEERLPKLRIAIEETKKILSDFLVPQ
ncbi:MAG TPA: response regulator, partial [Ignavibacteriales bacterium]|nr:response regulator [Ignavibacteriales bacterium]